MQNVPVVKVTPPRESGSRFFITLNTNRSAPSAYNAVVQLEAPLIRDISKLVEFLPAEDGKVDSWSTEHISRVEISYAGESGGKLHRAHGHAYVNIFHNTRLRMDVPKLRKWFCDEVNARLPPGTPLLEPAGVHCHIRCFNNTANVLRYVNKTLVGANLVAERFKELKL
jgi:hypothetical protein